MLAFADAAHLIAPQQLGNIYCKLFKKLRCFLTKPVRTISFIWLHEALCLQDCSDVIQLTAVWGRLAIKGPDSCPVCLGDLQSTAGSNRKDVQCTALVHAQLSFDIANNFVMQQKAWRAKMQLADDVEHLSPRVVQ